MSSTRWVIFRRMLLVLLLGAGVALAGRRAATPPPVVEPAPVQPSVPALPTAAPLFPGSLPVGAVALPEGLANLTAQSCNACHGEIHDRWQDSAHSRAWSSPTFRLALERVGQTTGCTGCHLPLANQHARLAAGYIEGDLARPDLRPNPAWEPSLMSEGVSCAACHVRDGKVLTTSTEGAAPHPLATSAELGSSEHCATCHQLTWPGADKPFYDTYGEWSRSAYASAGVGCVDCHMPKRAGSATGTRFAAVADHGFPADPARAMSILVRTDAVEVTRGQPFLSTITVQNSGAGHHLPTGSPYVGWRVVASLRDADGKTLVAPAILDLARDVSDAPPWSTLADSRLAAGEERSFEHRFTLDQKHKSGRGQLVVSVYAVTAAERLDARWSADKAGPPILEQRIPVSIL